MISGRVSIFCLMVNTKKSVTSFMTCSSSGKSDNEISFKMIWYANPNKTFAQTVASTLLIFPGIPTRSLICSSYFISQVVGRIREGILFYAFAFSATISTN